MNNMKIWKRGSWILAVAALALAGGCSQGTDSRTKASVQPAAENHAAAPAGTETLAPPSSVAAEHHELHEELAKVVALGGATGDAAKVVEQRLSSHFENEEKYGLPQLGLLSSLADGKMPADAEHVIELSDKLKAELPTMLAEHKAISEALEKLKTAAEKENKADAARFAEHLAAHAKTEEQIFYPAAILVGEYLKLRQK